jgi:hypothetical protein
MLSVFSPEKILASQKCILPAGKLQTSECPLQCHLKSKMYSQCIQHLNLKLFLSHMPDTKTTFNIFDHQQPDIYKAMHGLLIIAAFIFIDPLKVFLPCIRPTENTDVFCNPSDSLFKPSTLKIL